jgi:hypothetical protein
MPSACAFAIFMRLAATNPSDLRTQATSAGWRLTVKLLRAADNCFRVRDHPTAMQVKMQRGRHASPWSVTIPHRDMAGGLQPRDLRAR